MVPPRAAYGDEVAQVDSLRRLDPRAGQESAESGMFELIPSLSHRCVYVVDVDVTHGDGRLGFCDVCLQ